MSLSSSQCSHGIPRTWPRRRMVAVAIGNALESYDWNCYATFMTFFGPEFFPMGDAGSATLAALVVFAVGFLFRPLGGILLGSFSDRRGRSAALSLSIIMMAGGSLLIALTPSYEEIGVLAPALLVLVRMAQGLSVGGEGAAMNTYVYETAPTGRRGLYSSAIYLSATFGTVGATLLAVLIRSKLSTADMHSWGWRIPFAVGALLAVYGWLLRRRLNETEAFELTKGERLRHPTLEVLRTRPRSFALVAGLTIGPTVVYYTFAVYLPAYAQHASGIPALPALWAAVFAQLIFMISLPVLGILSDRFGRRLMMLVFGIGFTLAAPLLFTAIGSTALSLLMTMTIAFVLFGCWATAAPSAMSEIFPTRLRSSGQGLSYSFTVSIFGGTAPYLIEYLSAHHLAHYYPWYVSLVSLISTIAVFTYRSEKGRRTNHDRVGQRT